ncbi:hypothetical protein [Streptomyces sp. NPDC042319]|uniref:hypothetical protein n=1 Tax=Streptomyces sp. NPDC042319 TaxID=3154332 RepID=UPI0033CCCBDC
MTKVSADPDPKSSLLDDHASDGALQLMKYGLEQEVKDEVVVKGAPRLGTPRVVSASDKAVVLVDCVDGTNWLQYKRNGELKDDVPGSHFKTDAKVRRAGEKWKVSHLYLHEAGSC